MTSPIERALPPPKVPLQIHKASRTRVQERVLIYGESGAGKTKTSLRFASVLGKKVGVVDTEYGRANNFANQHEFSVIEISKYHPQLISHGIKLLEADGCDVIIVDSISDGWDGPGGCAELQSTLQRNGGRYKDGRNAWAAVKSLWRLMLREMMNSPAHIIATARETTDSTGKPKPVGERETPYLFDLRLRMKEGSCRIEKTDVGEFQDKVIKHPGEELMVEMRKAKGVE